MSFDLRGLLRHVIRAATEPDTRAIVAAAFAEIDEDDRAEALMAALAICITPMLGLVQMAERRGQSTEAMHEGTSTVRPIRPSVSAGHSDKVTAIREVNLRARLHENIYVGDGDRRRKFLGDCTVDDLDVAIAIHDTMAARNLARSNEKRRLREALASDEAAKVVTDLPKELLMGILLREAVA